MKEKTNNNKHKPQKIIIFIAIVAIILIYDFTPLIKVPLGYAKFGSESCKKYQYYQSNDNSNKDTLHNENKQIRDVTTPFFSDEDHPFIARRRIH